MYIKWASYWKTYNGDVHCVYSEAVGVHPVWTARSCVTELFRLPVLQLSPAWPRCSWLWSTTTRAQWDLSTMWNARPHSDG